MMVARGRTEGVTSRAAGGLVKVAALSFNTTELGGSESSMEILGRKDSKLLGRTEIRVHFGEVSGALPRTAAIKIVADHLKVDPANVGIVALHSGSGSRNLIGLFHVYDSKDSMKIIQEKYLTVRILSKEQREALKQAKKQAKQPKAK